MSSLPNEIPESPQASNAGPAFPSPLDVPVLERMKDYRQWAIRMRIALRALSVEHLINMPPGLSAYIDHRDFDRKKEAYAQHFLSSKLGKAALDCIQDADTLEEMWSKLRSQYLETGWIAESRLVSELVALKYVDCENMEEYISRFRDLIERISLIGRFINDKLLVYLLLSGLGREEADWVRARPVNAVAEAEPPRFDEVTAQLLHTEREEKASQDSSIVL